MNGGTHMPFEDVALYRVIPGSTVLEPSDPTCLISLLKQAVDRPGIKYLRVGRKSMARIYADGSELPIGKAPVLRDGTDVVIFAAGIMVHEALQAALSLEKQGVSAAVVDCYTIKPIDKETVTAMAKKTGAVVSIPPCWRSWRRPAPCPRPTCPWRTSSARSAPRATCSSASASPPPISRRRLRPSSPVNKWHPHTEKGRPKGRPFRMLLLSSQKGFAAEPICALEPQGLVERNSFRGIVCEQLHLPHVPG